MTQLHFTFKYEEIQSLVQESIDNKTARIILTKVFNELMEKKRDEYLDNTHIKEIRKVNHIGMAAMDVTYTTKVGTLSLRLPRTRDVKFSTEIFERYQRNEKAVLVTMLEMYIQCVSTRKVSRVIENIVQNNGHKACKKNERRNIKYEEDKRLKKEPRNIRCRV